MNIKMFKATIAGVLLFVSSFANAGLISLANGVHDMTSGISSLGHTVISYTNNSSGWTSIYASGADAVIIEENSATQTTSTEMMNYIMSGGRVILAGYSGIDGSYDNCSSATLMNSLFGSSLSTACTYISDNADIYTKTAAAIGTTFEDDALTLTGPSSVHHIISGLGTLNDTTVFYDGPGAQVSRTTLGAGDFFFIGWDYCCGITNSRETDYYEVLDSAINFERTDIPEPSTLAILALGIMGLASRRFKRH